MDQTEFRRLKNIFEAALDVAEEEREAFLDQACGKDSALREAVAEMLIADAADSPVDQPAIVEPKPQIDGYQLGPVIGEGGMSTVFEAVRLDEAVRHRVAIKMLHAHLSDSVSRSRFEQERAFLAQLSHPCIAGLIDGGSDANERPYLVMEYIEGQPITAYCQAENLPVIERLRLFQDVCAAVHHAHANLIVHRDIKPSNVLVTSDGYVKLLDFGIAKLMDEQADASSTRIMTPQYASPEQIRGEAVSTASDVYALGVLLYEILTDQPPYKLNDCTPAQIEQRVCHTPTRPPSKLLASHGHQQRSKSLRGDLDTVVLKAMQQDPERRYGSAAQLAEDIVRYLNNQPISARPDQLSYRLRKLVDRHKVAAALAGGLLVALVLFTAIMVWQVQQTRNALATAEQERAAANEVVDYLVSVFELADPTGTRMSLVTLEEVLERGARRAELTDTASPLLKARLLTAMGRVYVNLGDYTRAHDLLDQVQSSALDETLQAEHLAAMALALRGQGDYAEARAVVQDAIARAGKELGPNSAQTLKYRFYDALLARDQGQYRDALELLEALVPQQTQVLGSSNTDVGLSIMQLGAAHWLTGDMETAAIFYQDALQVLRSTLSPNHPHLASALSGMSILSHRQGRFEEGAEYGIEALNIQRKAFGPTHPYVARSESNLGALYLDAGDLDLAQQHLGRALAIQQDQADPPVAAMANTLNNLGLIGLRSQQYQDAMENFGQAIELASKVYGEAHPQLASFLDNRGLAALRSGDPKSAEAMFQRGLEIRLKQLGKEHPHTAYSHSHMAELFSTRGQYESAVAELEQAMEIRLNKFGPDHHLTETSRANLVLALAHAGRCDAAGVLAKDSPNPKVASTLETICISEP